MKATDYSVFIIWSKEDEAFLAQVPELPGCVADGPTREKALENATIAVQSWIETAQEIGREIPEPHALEWFEPADSETQLRVAVENELQKIIPELVLRVTASISPRSVGIVIGSGTRDVFPPVKWVLKDPIKEKLEAHRSSSRKKERSPTS